MYIYTRANLGKATNNIEDSYSPNIGGLGKKPIPGGSLSVVNTQMPTEGDGFVSQTVNRWGLKEVINALAIIGLTWTITNPTAPRIQIRDISRKGGGPLGTHKSHQMGLDVDIRLMRKDGKELPTSIGDKNYSQDLTQELVDMIHDNPILPVQLIFFDDEKVKRVRKDDNHSNHLHVRFCMPPKYKTVLGPFDRWSERNRGCDDPVSDVPPMQRVDVRSGRFYQIKTGDTLFGVTGRAYNVGPGGQRLKLAKHINNAEYNRRFWRGAPQNEIKWFPHGRISFSPRFADIMEQIKSKDKVPEGSSFALIWIPPRPNVNSMIS